MTSYENRAFREAAKDAGIRGTNWAGNKAIDDFSTYYHENFDKWVREGHGYQGVKRIASEWWKNNRHKYN